MTTVVVKDNEKQKNQTNKSNLTFAKAIELGEYNLLDQFSEYTELSRPSQYEFIKKAVENRIKNIWVHWSELSNLPDMSKKPQIREAMKKLELQHRKVMSDKEKIFIEFASPED